MQQLPYILEERYDDPFDYFCDELSVIAHFVMKAAFSHKLNFVVETWCFEEFEEGELRWGELRRDDPDHSSTELCKDCLRNMRDV